MDILEFFGDIFDSIGNGFGRKSKSKPVGSDENVSETIQTNGANLHPINRVAWKMGRWITTFAGLRTRH